MIKNLAVFCSAVVAWGTFMSSEARAAAQQTQWIMGFFGSGWTSVQPVSAIPWSKYTHAANAGAQVFYDSSLGQWSLDLAEQSIDQTSAGFVQGAHAHDVKALLLVGGSGANFTGATAPANIAAFVGNVVRVLDAYGYDGVDIDWETGMQASQFADLAARLRSALGAGRLITIDTGEWDNLPTAAAGAQAYLDQINVMCYDLSGGGTTAWHNDALYGAPAFGFGGTDTVMGKLVNAGIPKSKLGIGIPFYACRFTGVTQPLQTGATWGGTINYNSLVNDPLRWQDACQRWDVTYHVNYLSISSPSEFISYAGEREIKEIVDWGKQQGFGGFMTWCLNQEYLSNQVGDARYPLSTPLWQAVTGNGGSNTLTYGDANGDGAFTMADLNKFVDWLLARTTPPASGTATFTACDVNGDNKLDMADLNLFVDRLLGRIDKFPVEP
jgi:chitinase